MQESLEQVLADMRGDAAVLRRARDARLADVLDEWATRISRASEDYLRWLSEGDAVLRSGRSARHWRAHFAELEALGHAELRGRVRYYRALVIPQRANLEAARAAGRRHAA